MMDAAWAAKLQAVFELSPTILTVTGLDDGRIVEVNDAFLLATGYSRDEVIGRSLPEIAVWVDPSQRDAGLAALRAGRSIRNVEARFRAKHGREIVAITNADVVVIDGRSCILTALVDITDRVHAEAALRESERRFAQLFHANPLPMTIVSMRTHRHLDVNEAAVRHSGYTREEMLGRTKPELGFYVAPDPRDDLLHQLLARGQVRDFEVAFRTKTGEERQLLTSSEVITYEGEPAVLSVSVDITERKHLERTKDEFLAILSHELRNPLSAITNALGVLDRLATSGDLRNVVGIIGRQTARLTRLVDDLLDVARLTTGKIALRREAVDLRLLAERCVRALREAGRVREHQVGLPVLVAGSDPEPPSEIPADPGTGQRRRVLLVEDHADAREGLRLLLTYAGHEVETAEDAPSGLEKLRTFQPEIALIDIGLPDVDGYALARMARQTPESTATYLVALTGYGQAEDRQKALAAGFDTHLTKPVDPAG